MPGVERQVDLAIAGRCPQRTFAVDLGDSQQNVAIAGAGVDRSIFDLTLNPAVGRVQARVALATGELDRTVRGAAFDLAVHPRKVQRSVGAFEVDGRGYA